MALGAALVLSPLLLLALALLLIVGAIPIPQLREAILTMQLKAASTIGDSFVLVTRPVEGASIVGQVQRDLEWLSGKCGAMVVVAHSQGGAVVHQALRESIPTKLKLFFTFGSGLKKLEELKQIAARDGSHERSAALTLVALLLFSIMVWWFAYGATTIVRDPLRYMGGASAVLFVLIISLVMLWAGLRDHVRGIALPDLGRWIKRLTAETSWIDCYASDDPVSNGMLLNDEGVKAQSRQ